MNCKHNQIKSDKIQTMSIAEIIKSIKKCIDKGGIIYVCGNGGSSAETDHMVSEFVTHGIKAVSLNNPATITALANDYSFDQIFSIQIKTMCTKNDLVVGLSTSGKSKNIINTRLMCEFLGIEFLEWPREGGDTAEIQEYQLKLMHRVYKKI